MEVKLLPFTYNVPFFSIFLALLSAVSVPFLKNGEQALRMIRVVQAVVAALSAALLAHLWSGDSFTFMMGHFRPLGETNCGLVLWRHCWPWPSAW